MAFGRLERRAENSPMSDINMTPLIDVMLVLLVIFIIAAPLMASRLQLDLPKLDSKATAPAREALVLAIDAQGQLFLADQTTTVEALKERLLQVAARDNSAEIHLRADSRVPYGKVAELIGWIQQSGLTRIGFVTDPSGEAPGKP
jgi:biopolymer transport protein TolR